MRGADGIRKSLHEALEELEGMTSGVEWNLYETSKCKRLTPHGELLER